MHLAIPFSFLNRSSLSFVRVAVTDDNDNPPQFDSNIYTASISEKAGLNTIVTTVKVGSQFTL